MEVVWEKGGSGLVFYTDTSYWHNLEGGQNLLLHASLIFSVGWCLYIDFDEQCAKEDDWDVDTALYYDRGETDSSHC